MKALYPSIKKVSSLFIALIIFGVASAQKGDFASAGKEIKSLNYSTSTPGSIEQVVRIKARTDRKVLLNWRPYTGEVSHYVLERSTDGRNYTEAGLLFTGDTAEEEEYYYTDKFRNPYTGPLYYRLRVVGLEGSEIYTPVTIINCF